MGSVLSHLNLNLTDTGEAAMQKREDVVQVCRCAHFGSLAGLICAHILHLLIPALSCQSCWTSSPFSFITYTSLNVTLYLAHCFGSTLG